MNLKALPLLASLLGAALAAPGAQAQAPTAPSSTSTPSAPTATRTLWASGLEDPQGIVRDADGSVLIAEYGGGRIVRFAWDGKNKRVVASGLKGPAMLARSGRTVLVTERKANRVVGLNANGTVSPLGGAIEEPLGLAVVDGRPAVLSHTTSKLLRWDGREWRPLFAAGDAGRYGYRCLAGEPGGAFLITDEDSGQVLLLTPAGRLAPWAKDFASPSGVAIGPDGMAYVADEGDGTLHKIAADGQATPVASGLGKPRGLLFLDARTLLVTDRRGNVWHVRM